MSLFISNFSSLWKVLSVNNQFIFFNKKFCYYFHLCHLFHLHFVMHQQLLNEIFDIDSEIADDLFLKLELLCENPLNATTLCEIENLFNDAEESLLIKCEQNIIYEPDVSIIDLTGKINMKVLKRIKNV